MPQLFCFLNVSLCINHSFTRLFVCQTSKWISSLFYEVLFSHTVLGLRCNNSSSDMSALHRFFLSRLFFTFFLTALICKFTFWEIKILWKKCLFCWDLVCISFLKISCFPFVFVSFPSVCLHLTAVSFGTCLQKARLTWDLVFVVLSCVGRHVVELLSGHPRLSRVRAPVYRGRRLTFCALMFHVCWEVCWPQEISHVQLRNTYTFFRKRCLTLLVKISFFFFHKAFFDTSVLYRITVFLASPFSCHCFFFSQLFFTLQSKHSFLQLLGLWHRFKTSLQTWLKKMNVFENTVQKSWCVIIVFPSVWSVHCHDLC